MQRVEGPQTPFEVYCYQCQVTFPAETRRCLHCGAKVGARGMGQRFEPVPASEHGTGPPSPQDVLEEEEAESRTQLARRFGGLAVWGLIALSAILTRLCGG
ncbi:MAG: hypothetical protein AAF430_13465 [Myxococcota bacterium]